MKIIKKFLTKNICSAKILRKKKTDSLILCLKYISTKTFAKLLQWNYDIPHFFPYFPL